SQVEVPPSARETDVRTGIRLAFSSLALAACVSSSPPPPPPAPPPAVDSARPDPALLETRPRYALRPVPVTNAFREAVRRGTRTMDGRPGPEYWQQRVEYRIAAELDPERARVQAEETITYYNRSPDTLSHLVLLLYQNVFAPGVQRVRRVPPTDGITLESVAVDGLPAR